LIQIKALWLRQGRKSGFRVPGAAAATGAVHGWLAGGDECIAADRDLWFEELGFPHPAMPAKDLSAGKSPAGSRRRHTVAVGAEL